MYAMCRVLCMLCHSFMYAMCVPMHISWAPGPLGTLAAFLFAPLRLPIYLGGYTAGYTTRPDSGTGDVILCILFHAL
jgi:hypothetical protein